MMMTHAQSPDQNRVGPEWKDAVLHVPANMKHTMSADVDTIIIGTSVGPWATHHHGEHQHH